MEGRYDPRAIEKKWQEKWEEQGVFSAHDDSEKPKYYCLIEFPYPSGQGLHIGHIRSNTAMDIVARKRRMEGFDMLYPIGWDAFGLPTENYAIKTGIHPREVTRQNTDNFRRQLKRIGFSFDWSREINTTDPEYFKWTQWIFLQMLNRGLAYKATMMINWCPSCKIGLANEEVVDGKCERCGNGTEKREKEQWMLAITKYADRLHDDLDTVDYLEKIKIQQRNWIGRSEGTIVKFPISNVQFPNKSEISNSKSGTEEDFIEVFTTRVDTLFGCTYVVVAPEHPLIRGQLTDNSKQKSGIKNHAEVLSYLEETGKKTEMDRTAEGREKTGVRLEGIMAVNPINGEEVPVFVADYVLGDYGTGAVMAVPAHDKRDFAFAEKYDLPVRVVVSGGEGDAPFTDDGVLVGSGDFSGLASGEARGKIAERLEAEGNGKKVVKYKLRDWVFSRQRYWGEPIPVVHCERCGIVALPESELPLELPEIDGGYSPTDTGESPLAKIESWVNTTCPICGGPARRETDTMPNWAGSSWYFLRYADPKNDQALADPEKLKRYMPVDWYNGGMEHTTLHLLYSRFWNKFLHDIGVAPTSEPYQKRTSHGLILAEGGVKMSKSKGNVVNPDDIVSDFGADTLRIYEMFMGPFDQPIAWGQNGLVGSRRFLERVWKLQEKLTTHNSPLTTGERAQKAKGIDPLLHRTIAKVSEDIEAMRFNTAVSSMMILVNALEKESSISNDSFGRFLRILSPFAPHMAEELWEGLGNAESIAHSEWPVADPAMLAEETVRIVVSVNGKVRDTFEISADATEDDLKAKALGSEKIVKLLDDQEVRRVIVVPGKLVNIVV